MLPEVFDTHQVLCDDGDALDDYCLAVRCDGQAWSGIGQADAVHQAALAGIGIKESHLIGKGRALALP
jgi:hypothetical protein